MTGLDVRILRNVDLVLSFSTLSYCLLQPRDKDNTNRVDNHARANL